MKQFLTSIMICSAIILVSTSSTPIAEQEKTNNPEYSSDLIYNQYSPLEICDNNDRR